MENRMIGSEFDQFFIRKYFCYFRPDILIHSVIVIDVKKSAAEHIVSQVFSFFSCEINIAMTCHMRKGIIKEIRTSGFNCDRFFLYGSMNMFIAEPDQIGK